MNKWLACVFVLAIIAGSATAAPSKDFGSDALERRDCAATWAQCGGSGWTGATTCCDSGVVCTYSSEWYSQCVPGTASVTTSTTKSSTTTTTTKSATTTTTTKSATTTTNASSTTTKTTTTTTKSTTTAAATTTATSSGASAAALDGTLTITAGSSYYEVNTGNLVYRIATASCDITTIKYKGTELQNIAGGKNSHIASGLGTVTFTYTAYTDYAKFTCVTSTLTHYIMAVRGRPIIYLATYTTAEPTVGELRFIFRLDRNVLKYGNTQTGASSATSIVEGSDVFYDPSNNYTYSKFYSSVEFIRDNVHGIYGDSVGTWMVVPQLSYETSSGGPFFRDINTQNGEVYWYMNSGHYQTEDYRMGLHGPYALVVTDGPAPTLSSVDFSFIPSMSLTGYVGDSGRGTVTGTASGISSSFQIVIGFKNADSQYWTIASSSGAFTSPKMKPGTYTMTLFKNELEVATSTVTVTAGATTTANIASAEPTVSAIWQIGIWDGTPREFLNADKIETMHPSDPRMSSWSTTAFTIPVTNSKFPMIQWKDVNNGITITFTLTSSQIGARTLRIGTCLSQYSARPQVKVNSWTGPSPSAPSSASSRSITRGTWRGWNTLFTVNIPSGTLVAGTNTLTITSISGTTNTGFLSAAIVFDAIDLY